MINSLELEEENRMEMSPLTSRENEDDEEEEEAEEEEDASLSRLLLRLMPFL